MVEISAIGGAISALKAAKDIAQEMIGLYGTASFQAKLIEFQSKILDAQERSFAAHDERSALIETISQLEKEVADFKAWETEKKKYELQTLADGVFAYALKPDAQPPEPAHLICAACYQTAKKTILQRETHMPGRIHVWVCHSCGSQLYLGGFRHSGPS